MKSDTVTKGSHLENKLFRFAKGHYDDDDTVRYKVSVKKALILLSLF